MSSSYVTDETPAGAFEPITVSTVAIGITSTLLNVNETGGFHKRACKVFLTVESQPIRVRWDGTDPTDAVGHLLTSGSSLTIIGEHNVARLKMIRDDAADATVSATIYYNR